MAAAPPPIAAVPTPPAATAAASPRLVLQHGLGQFERVHALPAGLVHMPQPAAAVRCLYHAAKAGAVDEVREMLAAGVRPDAADQMTPMTLIPTQPGRRNALHFACIYGHVEIVRMLLDAGASVNSSDKFGWQPLHFAALNGRPTKLEITRLLLEAGGNRRATVAVQQHNSLAMRQPLNSPGRRPLTIAAAEFARRHGQPEVAALIDSFEPADGS